MTLPQTISKFKCPKCAWAVTLSSDGYFCKNPHCQFSAGYPTTHGQPIFIDSDVSAIDVEAVLERGGASSFERRSKNIIDRVLEFFRLSSAHVTRRNCAAFVNQVIRTGDPRPTVVVIGGGVRGAGTEPLYLESNISLLSFDVYASSDTHFIADGHYVPMRDKSVDAVWIQAVLEHVIDPTRVASEIHRILKERGVVYSEVPFLQHVHEGPHDFTRFTLSGHRYLFRNFDLVDAGTIGGPGTQLLWSVEYFVRALTRSRVVGKATKLLFIWLVWFDRFSGKAYATDAASGTFFLGRKSESSLSATEIVRFYRGADR